MLPEFTDSFPRFHTALAEWIACILFIFPAKQRLDRRTAWLVCPLFLFFLLITNLVGEQKRDVEWLLWMGFGLALMLLLIHVCCLQTLQKSLFIWAYAFLTAELVASLEWQISCFLCGAVFPEAPEGGVGAQGALRDLMIMAVCYLILFGGLALLLRKRHFSEAWMISWKEAEAACMITFGTFFLSNIQFAIPAAPIQMLFGSRVRYTRTLVDLVGAVLLLAYAELRRKVELEMEVKAMQSLLNQQYEQYVQFEQNSEALHRIHHDLKHQIAFLRAENNTEKREGYLQEMEETLDNYGTAVQTGYSVLDTLLTGKKALCRHEDISLSCFAHGKCLAFIDVMDLCSIFGNALDNAIQYEKSLENKDSRLICVRVEQEEQFAVIQIENYCDDNVTFENGIPVNYLTQGEYHGYGAKSIRRAVQKYGGQVRFFRNENWFVMKAVLPIA